jgi:superfamily I DNA/RNA helicase
MSPDPSWQDAELLQVKDLGLPPDAPEFLAKTAASILTYLNDKRIQTCEVRNTTTPQGTNFEVVQTETVTILTRTNKQAQEIQSKIEEFAKARNDVRALRWLNDLEDGLFENENAIAARTLLALLRWLASPEDLEATFNLMVTGWTEKFLDWRVAENLLLSENEDERAKLKALLDPIRAELQEAQTRSLSMPIPALLAWAVDRYPIAGRGSELTNPDDASRQRLLGNLRLVMAHLATDSSESQWNIAGCIAWLEMKLATDASSSDKTPAWKPTAGKADKVCRQRPTDDELYREPVQIQAMTAHKAKGLEFRHVVLPCLHQPIFVGSDGLFASTGELRWQFKYEPQEQQEQQEPQLPRKGKILSHTDVEENEKREVLREEARLLYVALTRAKKSVLLIHGTPDAKSHAWVAPFLLPKI